MKIGALGILFSQYYTSRFYVWSNVFFFCFFRFYGVVQPKPQDVVQQQLSLKWDMEEVLFKDTKTPCTVHFNVQGSGIQLCWISTVTFLRIVKWKMSSFQLLQMMGCTLKRHPSASVSLLVFPQGFYFQILNSCMGLTCVLSTSVL